MSSSLHSATKLATIGWSEMFNLCKNSDGEYVEFYQPLLSSILRESLVDSETSGCNSTPSVCFSLFLQYTKQLSRLSSRLEFGVSDGIEDEYSDEFTLLRFENEEHEESYKKLRNRERRHEYRHNYAKEYGPTTEYGDVVLQQRLLMVNWIIEKRELQSTSRRIGWPIWWTTNWSLNISFLFQIHCRSPGDAVVAHGKRWYPGSWLKGK
ncbi:cyclin-SDS-like [Magnolia sinica]|uniref:cyclin-SDS-like n=1 Tax=Magnolia sinica TaxID=86752 RepID=UPI002659E75C|nr:cyclin-SDS-like [Magnolia sinica]